MNEIANKVYQGGCACGAVRFTATGEPVVVAQCHCVECQRTSGTGHSTGVMFPVGAVQVLGETSTYTYTAANGNEVSKVFCPNCSSSVYGTNSGNTAHMTLAVGCMDDMSAFPPQVVIFTSNCPDWDMIDPDLPSFATQPDWKPE